LAGGGLCRTVRRPHGHHARSQGEVAPRTSCRSTIRKRFEKDDSRGSNTAAQFTAARMRRGGPGGAGDGARPTVTPGARLVASPAATPPSIGRVPAINKEVTCGGGSRQSVTTVRTTWSAFGIHPFNTSTAGKGQKTAQIAFLCGTWRYFGANTTTVLSDTATFDETSRCLERNTLNGEKLPCSH